MSTMVKLKLHSVMYTLIFQVIVNDLEKRIFVKYLFYILPSKVFL